MSKRTDGLLEEYRRLLGLQIKLDIAALIREHPHLEGRASQNAFNELASNETIDKLVRELAYEETQDAVSRGKMPPPAMLALAGFMPTRSRAC